MSQKNKDLLEEISKVLNPPKPDKSLFISGNLYRYIGAHLSLPMFRTKEAAGSFPHTSEYEHVGELFKNESFLVLAVEPFVLNDLDDEGNSFWDDEFIKIMTTNYIGWINIGLQYQTTKHFEEMTEEVAEKEVYKMKEREEKTLGGLGHFDSAFLVKRKTL